jgi:hypothetical protein
MVHLPRGAGGQNEENKDGRMESHGRKDEGPTAGAKEGKIATIQVSCKASGNDTNCTNSHEFFPKP